MTVQFHFLDAFEEIPIRLLQAVQRELHAALAQITTLLPIAQVDVVVAPAQSQWVIPEYGLTGMSHGKGRITISIDPDSPHVDDPQREARLLGILAHELHHVTRMRGPGYGRTLGEALVSEGLAQCFEVEAGAPVPFYGVALDPGALTRAGERARQELGAPMYDHAAWFMGRRGDPAWPRNAGYSLAFALVEDWLAHNDTNAAAAARVPAAQVLDAWRERNFELPHPMR
jgi:uncharacterized protein YjaZ